MNLQNIVRKSIRDLKPYSTARDEYQGNASVFLDANENPFNSPYNRYPDPLQWKLKGKISCIKGVAKEKIMLANGSDEAIDLIVRIFCEPRIDNIVTLDPSYGMYKVVAGMNDVEVRQYLLNEDFDFKAADLLKITDENTKVIFLCSPNNPTGNLLDRNEVLSLIKKFEGIVVVDEAYIDFSSQPSYLIELDSSPNLIVLQTFSKAWGSAGVRLGMAFASEEIIRLINKVKYPYNINNLTQEYALQLLDDYDRFRDWVATLLKERTFLEDQLKQLKCVEKIYSSEANYILIRVKDANGMYQYLIDKGIIVRNRNNVSLCLNCLRITVGTNEENRQLVDALREVI